MNSYLAFYCILLVVRCTEEIQAFRSDKSPGNRLKAHLRDNVPSTIHGSYPNEKSSEIEENHTESPRVPAIEVPVPDDQFLERLPRKDIWQDSTYTQCILISRKIGNKWFRACHPGKNKTDYLLFDNAENCRLMDAKCYKVHRDDAFLEKFFSSPKPTYILPCLILEDECFLLDRERNILLETNMEECYESFCRRLTIDPENHENFCYEYSDCGNSLFVNEDTPRDDETSDPPFPVPNGNMTSSALIESLQTILQENNFQGEPTGSFYSIAVLHNGSISAVFSATNNTQFMSSTEANDGMETSTIPNESEDEITGSADKDILGSTQNISENFEENDDAKRSGISSLPVKILSNESASSLLHVLKEVLPKNMFVENPSVMIYSLVVLFKKPESEMSATHDDSNTAGVTPVENLLGTVDYAEEKTPTYDDTHQPSLADEENHKLE